MISLEEFFEYLREVIDVAEDELECEDTENTRVRWWVIIVKWLIFRIRDDSGEEYEPEDIDDLLEDEEDDD